MFFTVRPGMPATKGTLTGRVLFGFSMPEPKSMRTGRVLFGSGMEKPKSTRPVSVPFLTGIGRFSRYWSGGWRCGRFSGPVASPERFLGTGPITGAGSTAKAG